MTQTIIDARRHATGVAFAQGVRAHMDLGDMDRTTSPPWLRIPERFKSRLAPDEYPRWIEFVADLPKTATGKIQRFKLRAACKTSS